MNILDYLDWRGDLSFEVSARNEVDALIFAWLSYYRFEELFTDEAVPDGLTLRELSALHAQKNGPFQPIKLTTTIQPSLTAAWLLYCAGQTERFGSVRICDFLRVADHAEGVQFAAVSFLIGDAQRVIAYRGTDDSVAGWKEDCRLSFLESVPAQAIAARYLEDVADGRGTLLCGHSKGGNLAVYAALHASEARIDSIDGIYNFDGPGFCYDTIDSERFARIRDRIITIVPESSIVGMLLDHDEEYRVVESQMAGILQHDAMFWQVKGVSFVYSEKLNVSSVIADKALRDWIQGMSPQERQEFVDALFGVIESTGVEHLAELPERIVQSGIRTLADTAPLSPQHKKMALRLLLAVVKAGNAKLYESAMRSGIVADIAKGIADGTGQITEAVERKLDAMASRSAARKRASKKPRLPKSKQ